MLKRLVAAIAAVSAAIAAGVALAVVPRTDAAVSPQSLAEIAPPDPASSQPSAPSSREAVPAETTYLLGEYNGRVSVLSPETREPEMIFDIFVRTLPDPDQELLHEGIRVSTYEELTRLIEDYIS